jgi:hypothetical protein
LETKFYKGTKNIKRLTPIKEKVELMKELNKIMKELNEIFTDAGLRVSKSYDFSAPDPFDTPSGPGLFDTPEYRAKGTIQQNETGEIESIQIDGMPVDFTIHRTFDKCLKDGEIEDMGYEKDENEEWISIDYLSSSAWR